MRVLLVVHGFPPAANGGTEIYVEALKALRAQIGAAQKPVRTGPMAN